MIRTAGKPARGRPGAGVPEPLAGPGHDAGPHTDFGARYTAACGVTSLCAWPDSCRGGPPTINRGAPAIGRAAIAAAAQGFMTVFPDLVVVMDIYAPRDPPVQPVDPHRHDIGPGGAGRRVHISGYEEWTFCLMVRSRSRWGISTRRYRAQLQGW